MEKCLYWHLSIFVWKPYLEVHLPLPTKKKPEASFTLAKLLEATAALKGSSFSADFISLYCIRSKS